MLEVSPYLVALFLFFTPAKPIPACTGPPTEVGKPCKLKLTYIARNKEEARAICTRHWPRAVVNSTFDANGIYCHYETTFECKDKEAHLIYDTCYTALPGKMLYVEALTKCFQQAAELPVFYGKQQLKFVTLLAASLHLSTVWTDVNNTKTNYSRYSEERPEHIRKVQKGQKTEEREKNLVILRARSVNDEDKPRGYFEKVDETYRSGALCAKRAITPIKAFCRQKVGDRGGRPYIFYESDDVCLFNTFADYTHKEKDREHLEKACLYTAKDKENGYSVRLASAPLRNRTILKEMQSMKSATVTYAYTVGLHTSGSQMPFFCGNNDKEIAQMKSEWKWNDGAPVNEESWCTDKRLDWEKCEDLQLRPVTRIGVLYYGPWGQCFNNHVVQPLQPVCEYYQEREEK